MSQHPNRGTHDGSALLEAVNSASNEVEHSLSSVQAKIDMHAELNEQTIDSIKSVFDKFHAILRKTEDDLLETAKGESGEALKSQKVFQEEGTRTLESIKKLQRKIKESLSVMDPFSINADHRKIEEMSTEFSQMRNKVFEPVFIQDKEAEKMISELKVGQVERKSCFMSDQRRSDDEWAELKPDLIITEPDAPTFSLNRDGVDLKESIISSFVWKNGKIVVTDKSNKKLKIFTEGGRFLHEMLFSNAEPYGVAFIDTADNADTYVVTFPKAKYVYIVCCNNNDDNLPLSVPSYFETKDGYSGVTRGPHENSFSATVVCSSGQPRIDVLDFTGKLLKSFHVDRFDKPLFTFPRYILTAANVFIVSDYKRNEIIFLDYNRGTVVGKYTGFSDHPLINPFGITVDGEGNVYVIDGKTGNIHVFDPRFRIISVIKCGSTLFNPRLLEFDIPTKRLAITHGAGNVTKYPINSNYKIDEFDSVETSADKTEFFGSGFKPIPIKDFAGPEGLLMLPNDQDRAPSPGF